MLTPYEFGLETGRLQAQIHETISEERAKHLAHILGIEEKIEFVEGYRNGFLATRKLLEEVEGIEPSDEELDETEQNFDLSGCYCDCGEALEEGHECEEKVPCPVCGDPECWSCNIPEE